MRVYYINLSRFSFLCALVLNACVDDGVTHIFSDVWCEGYGRCYDYVAKGEIKKVSTWNERDYGIELVGSLVEVEHINDSIDWPDIVLELVAYVEPSAQVSIDVDYWYDDYIDCTHTIPESNWESLRFTVHGPSDYEGIRFVVRKKGKGRVVIARLKARSTTQSDPGDQPGVCESGDYKAPYGYPCVSDDECVAGKCSPTLQERYLTQLCTECIDNEGCSEKSICEEDISLRCSECRDDSDCLEGDVCGLISNCPIGPGCEINNSYVTLYRRCVGKRFGGIGQRCYNDSECASGFCDSWPHADFSGPFFPVFAMPEPALCHECRTDSDCDSDRVCGLSFLDFLDDTVIARCVDPGSDPLGDACRSDSECAEGLFCVKGESSGGICGECDQTTACENGLICHYTTECIAPRILALGDACISDDACESGICFPLPGSAMTQSFGTCSECTDDSDCEQGQSCVDSYEETEEFYPTCWPRE
jgi:hypothetical protein